MAAGNFSSAMRPLFGLEGGVRDRPLKDDPGGLTNLGITQRVYSAYLADIGRPDQSVRMITRAEALDIYKRYYWDSVWGDKLPAGIDICVFDAAVNSGPPQAIVWLQRAIGVDDDSAMGFRTLNATREADPLEVIDSICDQRWAFMQKLKNFQANKIGWNNRVKLIRKTAKSWARAAASGYAPTDPEVPPAVAEESGKALPSEIKPTETPEGKVVAQAGPLVVLQAILGWISQFSDHLALLTGLPPKLLSGVIIFFFVAAFLALLGIGYFTVRELIKKKIRREA